MGVIFDATGLSTAPTNEALDKGLYGVEIKEVSFSNTKKKGTPELAFKTEIVDGPVQKDGSISNGRPFTHRIWFTDNNREISLGQLKAICKAAEVEIEDEANLDLGILEGRKVRFQIKEEDYEGSTTNKVTSVKAF